MFPTSFLGHRSRKHLILDRDITKGGADEVTGAIVEEPAEKFVDTPGTCMASKCCVML